MSQMTVVKWLTNMLSSSRFAPPAHKRHAHTDTRTTHRQRTKQTAVQPRKRPKQRVRTAHRVREKRNGVSPPVPELLIMVHERSTRAVECVSDDQALGDFEPMACNISSCQ